MSPPRAGNSGGTKRILITGCASGIGRHLAGALAARGHRVAATDVNEAALEEAAREGGWRERGAVVRRLDVRVAGDWEAALDEAERAFGAGIDVLLNVAGWLRPAWALDVSDTDVERHFEVNVKGVVLGTRAAARRMVRSGGGHVVNFGSLASLAPVPGLSLYVASKFAVRGFSLAAAVELARHGIATTLVMPDAVATPMLDLQLDYEEAAMTFTGPRPLTVAEIEEAVVDVLHRKPLEVTIPRSRGALVRVANAMPHVMQRLAPFFRRKGLRAQAEARARRAT